MIDKQIINELIARADIVEVISRFRDVKKQGSNYFCLSPFTEEKTPSCAIHKAKQIYKDFSSGKGGGVISYLMDAEKMDYLQAVKYLAQMYNFEIFDENNKVLNAATAPDYEKRPASVEEKEGEKLPVTKEFTMAELREIFSDKIIKWCEQDFSKGKSNSKDAKDIKKIYKKLFDTLTKYNVYCLASLTFIKDRKAHIIKSNERYPIFMFEFVKFRKFYQPKAKDKARRFIYDGEKPQDFIFGYEQTIKAAEKLEKLSEDENADDDTLEKRKTKKKLDAIIECTGERDSLNVAVMGYEVICLGTESAVISPAKLYTLFSKTNAYYRLPDIDPAGKASNHKVCMDERSDLYLDIKTIVLPESLKNKLDFRGNPCKDIRDYLNFYTPKQFTELVSVALPYRFWDQEKAYTKEGDIKMKFGKPVMQYVLNNLQMYNFLKMNGFFRLKSDNDKRGYIYIRIQNSTVSEIEPNDVKAFIHDFLEQRKMSGDLRNTFYRSTQITESSLSNLSMIELDFKDYTPEEQFFFFQDKVWKVDKHEIKEFKAGSIDKYVWADEVVPNNVKKMDDFFKIIHNQSLNDYDIEILNQDCLFFKYLINTSRIHWRNELEEKIKAKSADEQEAYRLANKFNIAGPLLSPEEILEQKQHLINKIYAIGYLIHRYKDASRPWCVFAMDNKISEDGESHGGSGKSLAFKSVRRFMKTVTLDGRNPKLTDNPHIYERVTVHTDMILIDDANQFLKFDYFFAPLTGDMTVNPKNNKQYEIPFNEVPKFVITSNYTLRNIDPSTERRLLYTVFSDYYHITSNGDYQENREPKDDFGKKLFDDFTEEEWNLFCNFIAQCCKAYLNFEKINPPMDNVNTRVLLSEMGMAFEAWADTFFSKESGNLDTCVIKKHAFKRFVDENKVSWTPQKFTKALKAWVRMKRYILDPKELHNNSGRIIRRKATPIFSNGAWIDGAIEPFEMLYIQTLDHVIDDSDGENIKKISNAPEANQEMLF